MYRIVRFARHTHTVVASMRFEARRLSGVRSQLTRSCVISWGLGTVTGVSRSSARGAYDCQLYRSCRCSHERAETCGPKNGLNGPPVGTVDAMESIYESAIRHGEGVPASSELGSGPRQRFGARNWCRDARGTDLIAIHASTVILRYGRLCGAGTSSEREVPRAPHLHVERAIEGTLAGVPLASLSAPRGTITIID